VISSVEAVETHRSAGENAVLRRGRGALQPFAHHTGRAREECSGCGSLRGLIRTPIHVGEPGEIENPGGGHRGFGADDQRVRRSRLISMCLLFGVLRAITSDRPSLLVPLSGFSEYGSTAILPLFCGLIFEPEVVETRAVVDAVDHQGQPFHSRLPAGGLTGIEDDRANVVLGQSPFDLPHQLPAFVPIRLP
jgi:hypothetical protein